MRVIIIGLVLSLFVAGCWPPGYHMGPNNGPAMHQGNQSGYGPHM